MYKMTPLNIQAFQEALQRVAELIGSQAELFIDLGNEEIFLLTTSNFTIDELGIVRINKEKLVPLRFSINSRRH